jgi:hypothetical protein
MKPRPLKIPNELAQREPAIVKRLAVFREQVIGLLLDKLAEGRLRDPAFGAEKCPYSLEEIKAVALVVHALTLEKWTSKDLRILDACWRDAILSDLFADEWECERHRIQQCVTAGQESIQEWKQLVGIS